jgi:hypothetical protein
MVIFVVKLNRMCDPVSDAVVERIAAMSMVLIIILVLLLIGVLPAWPHSANWHSAPYRTTLR